MCKTFSIISDSHVDRFECIGDLFIHSINNKEYGVLTSKAAHDKYVNTINHRATYVRMSKREVFVLV